MHAKVGQRNISFNFKIIFGSFNLFVRRLITGFGNAEMTPPKPQPGTSTKPSASLFGDSEELNRVVSLYFHFAFSKG
jgi:hypothetical protein